MSDVDTETRSAHASEATYLANRRARPSVLRKYGERANDVSVEMERKRGPEDFAWSC